MQVVFDQGEEFNPLILPQSRGHAFHPLLYQNFVSQSYKDKELVVPWLRKKRRNIPPRICLKKSKGTLPQCKLHPQEIRLDKKA